MPERWLPLLRVRNQFKLRALCIPISLASIDTQRRVLGIDLGVVVVSGGRRFGLVCFLAVVPLSHAGAVGLAHLSTHLLKFPTLVSRLSAHLLKLALPHHSLPHCLQGTRNLSMSLSRLLTLCILMATN